MMRRCPICKSYHRCDVNAKKKAKTRKAQRREQDRVLDAVLRADVMERAEMLCELWPARPHEGSEPHHLEGGSGRRALQCLENTMWACRMHHNHFHRSPEAYRAIVADWTAEHGYPTPRRFRREPVARSPSKSLSPTPASAAVKQPTPRASSGSGAGGGGAN